MVPTVIPDIPSGLFQSVFEASPIPAILLKAGHELFSIAAVNDAFLTATGNNRERLIGKNILDLFLPQNGYAEPGADEINNSLQRVMEEGIPTSIQILKSKFRVSGQHLQEELWQVDNTPLQNDGAVSHILQSFTDAVPKENKVAEARSREEHFRYMVEQAPIAIGILRGQDMVIEMANPQLLNLWGKTKAVIGLPVIEGLPEISDQPFPALLRSVYETGNAFYGYETLARLERNGKLEDCYFNFVYTPNIEKNGRITGVTVIANEVTPQVMAKKELELSEKRFRTLLQDTDVATAVYVGRDMVIQLANNAMIKLWGKDASVRGMKLENALPELEGQPFMDLLRNVYDTGETYKATEDRADLVVDGQLQTFYFNFTYKALRNAEGNIYGILNMAVDVTDLVMERAKVRQGEERLKIATEGTGVATWDLDLTNGNIIYSPRLNEIMGVEKHVHLSHADIRNKVHPDHVVVLDKAMDEARTTGLYSYEARITWTDGSPHWIRTQGRIVFNENNEPVRMLGIMMDITTQRNTSEKLKASEERYRRLAEELERRVQERTNDLKQINAELVRSNDELQQFAFVTSHDLQEPLRKIRTFSNILLEKNNDMLDDRGRLYLDKINVSAGRMSELIKSLLNFSRLKHSNNEFKEVDLNQVLADVLIDFELLIKQKDAVVTNEGLPTIQAIELHMSQLFYNLLSNALKFTDPDRKPEVTFSSKMLTAAEVDPYQDLDSSLAYTMITVRDNGIGFAQEYADKVFEIFQRLNNKSNYEGTGIGLALCNKIVINHKGIIFAEAALGKGAAFHIILPLVQE